jgi:hypothetical protein
MEKPKSGITKVSLKTGGRFVQYEAPWETEEKVNPVSIYSVLPFTKYNKVILTNITADKIELDVNLISESLKDSLISGIRRERSLK